MTSRLIKALGIIVALLLPGKVLILRADDNGRTLISREGILAALHSSGIPAVPEQMEELSKITAAEANPPLKVTSIDVMDGESDKVLLRCEHANTCLPFYVLVHWGHAGTGSIGSWGRTENDLAQSSAKPETFLVRSGKIVRLVLDGNYIHMTLPVLCLQSGGRGQRVRVISKDTKKRYVALVTGLGVVRSTMAQ